MTESSSDIALLDRYRGALLGLAAGDALGTTLEFCAPGSFAPISDMVGGGPFGLQAGQWTDDTSMALCLATSLVECRGFDARDQIDRYVRWWQQGYMSSNGRCFDIGVTVRSALQQYVQTGEPYAGSGDSKTAGNGSIMRLAPVVLAFANDPLLAITRAADSSRTTHATQAAVDGCRYLAALLLGALRGEPKAALLAPRYSPLSGLWEANPLHPAIDAVATGSFREQQPPAIRGTGYVVASLEAALWAFYHSDNFRDGCLLAVNLGDDADTTGAVYGQIAGAFYGERGIPAAWLNRIVQRDLIAQLAEQLLQLKADDSDTL
ncbi:MAG: ADP-ribosylglycohydrolase family protein [Roseiflexaceae bacterium]|nr:ADP-ribosylglycohydrolase family protein [Roseiflexaceae bacterium]